MKHYPIEILKNSISLWPAHVKQDLIEELEVLRAIAEAAEPLMEQLIGIYGGYQLEKALKAWRDKK